MTYINPILEREAAEINGPKQIRVALRTHYADLEEFIEGVANNRYHLIVNGPSGCGKTEFTRTVLDKQNANATIISGTMSPIKLFAGLYECRKKGQILVIDDTDSLLEKTESLDILKAAMDSQPRKAVSWKKYSAYLSSHGLPDEFVYKGRLIIITNKVIHSNSWTKLGQALVPVLKRFQYFPAGLPSREWDIEAMRMFVDDGKVRYFNEARFSKQRQNEIMEFIIQEQDYIGTISFRALVQISELIIAHPKNWKKMALISLGA